MFERFGGCLDSFFIQNFQNSGAQSGKKKSIFKSRRGNNPRTVSENLKEFGLRKRVCFNGKIDVHEEYRESRWIVDDFDQSGLANEGIYELYKKSGGTWFIMEKEYFLDNQLNEPSKLANWYEELNKQYGGKVVIETNFIVEESWLKCAFPWMTHVDYWAFLAFSLYLSYRLCSDAESSDSMVQAMWEKSGVWN